MFFNNIFKYSEGKNEPELCSCKVSLLEDYKNAVFVFILTNKGLPISMGVQNG